MFSDDTSYFDLFIGMTIRGLLLGALFGMIYGTVFFPIIGSIFGLFYGSVMGIVLGLGNGLLLVLISFAFVMLQRRAYYMQICTLCCTLFSIVAGMYGFGVITGQGNYSNNGWYSLMTTIPAIIAGLLTGWVAQGLTFRLEKRKGKPKEKATPPDTWMDSDEDVDVAKLAEVLVYGQNSSR